MGHNRHFYDEFSGRLRSFVAARASNKSDIDDIVQETFLKYHSRGAGAEIKSSIGYLYGIAMNLMIDQSRRRAPLNNSLDIGSVGEASLSIAPCQEHGRRLDDLQRAYQAALNELSPRCAEVFYLRRHCERSTPDVAAQLSITTRMVQKHMVAAMAHLQLRLRPFLVEGGPQEPGEDRGADSRPPTRCQMASSSAAHA
jgi:RNA polymerase sigma factor (sigma-70 family)